eukprot:SAG31_NODE_26079_length_449_cov_0.414286_2_plen_81_part_01
MIRSERAPAAAGAAARCRPVAGDRGISGDQMDAFLSTCQGFPEPGDMIEAPSRNPPPQLTVGNVTLMQTPDPTNNGSVPLT